ncbi:TonB-dependent receptor plug domain-containing protein [Phenylobacterium sp.]|uniref:TonB-dependent receptor n=1 Tax=Phenylobacterium sp. TaxID=1871053 RepID=UPI00301CCAE2
MHSDRLKVVLCLATSVAAILLAAPALAQTATSASAGAKASAREGEDPVAIEEVVVTARRVEENLQDVPIPITAFTRDQLARTDVKDLFSLVRQIPGVQLCCNNAATFVNIRGITNGAPTYFADVPAPPGGFFNFFDIQNVQILKGPQGTLFGQASNAGAVVYEPTRPGSEFGGYVQASVGGYNRRELQGALDVPLADDKVLVRLAGQTYYRDGTLVDISNKNDYGEQDFYVVRPSLILRPTENLENYTLFQYAKTKGRPIGFALGDFNMRSVEQAISATPGGTFAACVAAGQLACVQAAFNGGSPAAFNALRDQVLARQIELGPYKIDGLSTSCSVPGNPTGLPGPAGAGGVTTLNYPRVACPYSASKNYMFVNQTRWNFTDGWYVKNILGYRWSSTFNQPSDLDGTLLVLGDGGSPRNNRWLKQPTTFSDELQLHGKIGSLVDLTVGGFHTMTWNHPALSYGFNFGSSSLSLSKTSSFTWAGYGQADIDLSGILPGLSLTAGYRRTWDTVNSLSFALNPATSAVIRTVGGRDSAAGHGEFKSGSYTLQLQYKPTDDILLYLNNSKGFGTGGLQNVAGFETFEPDSLNNFEVGVKSIFDIAGMQARFNGSVYYGKFDNVKANVVTQITNSVTGVTTTGIITRNAAAALIRGAEAEGDLVVNSRLRVGGWVAYNDDKYTKYPSLRQVSPGVFVPLDLSDTPFSFSPKWKWNLRAAYRLPLADELGDLTASGTVTWQDVLINAQKPPTPSDPRLPEATGLICSHTRTIANGYGPLSADGKTVPVDCNPSYYNVDVSLDWRNVLGYDGLTASFIVTNVTKNKINDGGGTQNSVLHFTSVTGATPRMWVLKFGYNF